MFNLTEKDKLNKKIVDKSRKIRDLSKENSALYNENKDLRFENEELKDTLKDIYKLTTCNRYGNEKVFLDKINELVKTAINN